MCGFKSCYYKYNLCMPTCIYLELNFSCIALVGGALEVIQYMIEYSTQSNEWSLALGSDYYSEP